MKNIESKFSVDETIDRLKTELHDLEIPIFAIIDHSENAKKVNMQLPPTKVIFFGNPSVGTKLMMKNQSVALELPLKIAVWEDNKGIVWETFPLLKPLMSEFGLENDPIISSMQILLENLVKKSANK